MRKQAALHLFLFRIILGLSIRRSQATIPALISGNSVERSTASGALAFRHNEKFQFAKEYCIGNQSG
jgi:hypothetical protein